jgi:predicted alpha/beta-fold hydrolase
MNRLARSYHSGDSAEIDWILQRLRGQNSTAKLYAVGVSLGGNMLLKWLGEQGDAANSVVDGAVAISAPVDLHAAAAVLDSSYRRAIYTRHFLESITRKVLAKISQHRLDIDPATVRASKTFRQIDDLYTAPVHGFKDADDYWTRASSKPFLGQIKVPTLLLNARNDPFLPPSALPSASEISSSITVDFPQAGGHVGFVSGGLPGQLGWLPGRVLSYLTALR